MNKNYFVLTLLLASSAPCFAVDMGVEFTWPLSALLMVGQGSNFVTTVQELQDNGGIPGGAAPQVNGYYATSNPFCIALQRGILNWWQKNGNYAFWFNRDKEYTSPTVYYSDIVRAMRSPEIQALNNNRWDNYNNLTTHCNGATCPIGPQSAFDRGFLYKSCPPPAGVCPFDRGLSLIVKQGGIGWYNNTSGALLSASWLNFDVNSFYPSSTFNGEAKGFYFAQTNTQYVYLPLHMVSPGDHLLAADPNYVNFGPLPPGKNGNPTSGWLPWTSGYKPRNVPYETLKSVVPRINVNSEVEF